MKAQLGGVLIEEAASGAALIGVILTSQGYLWADPMASTVIAAVIALIGVKIFKDNVDYFLGRAPSKEFMEKIESTTKSVKGVLGVHDLRAEYIGPNVVHTDFHIEVVRGTPIEEDRIAEEVRDKVGQETGCQHCVIHIDPENSSKI